MELSNLREKVPSETCIGKCSVSICVRRSLGYEGVGPLTNTERVPHEKDNKKLLRFVGRTHANIILTLSRPIRGELLYSNSLFSKAPLHKGVNKGEEQLSR